MRISKFTLPVSLLYLSLLVSQSSILICQASFDVKGHSHNDYVQVNPLMDALKCGVCSVEVDIILKNNTIVVSHSPIGVGKKSNFENLYLVPLMGLIMNNELTLCNEINLMIEMKQRSKELFHRLDNVLSKYSSYLSCYNDTSLNKNRINIILTGWYPRNINSLAKNSIYFIDGTIMDLGKNIESKLMPQIGVNFRKVVDWQENEPFSTSQRKKLQVIINVAHAEGKSIRFWKCPNNINIWEELYNMKVDWLNVDNLTLFSQYKISKIMGIWIRLI